MDTLLTVYKCLCDETRLRMLNLLLHSPLCVCHLQHLLGISQVNASRHLGVLRKAGMVIPTKVQNWTLYSLPDTASPELDRNLACLQDLAGSEPVFLQDLRALTTFLDGRDIYQVMAKQGCEVPNPIPGALK